MSQQRQQLLLIEDVEDLGRKGEIVKVKLGFFRNFLHPRKKAVIADKHTLKIQKKLQEERAMQAAKDRIESEKLAKKLEDITLKKEVKVDPEGNIYGSVTALDIVALLKEENIQVKKNHIKLVHPIKETGSHKIPLKLQEGVEASVIIKILPEGVMEAVVDEVALPQEEKLEKIEPEEEVKLTKKEKEEIKKATKKI